MPGMTPSLKFYSDSPFKADYIVVCFNIVIIEFHTTLPRVIIAIQIAGRFERHLIDRSARQNQVFSFVLRRFDSLVFLRPRPLVTRLQVLLVRGDFN